MWKSLVGVTLLFLIDAVVCKPDYLFDQEVKGWLSLHAGPATWQRAFFNCHYEGAVLASPINAELATALLNIMKQSKLGSPIFLGVNAYSQGVFMSVEGVPLADLSVTWGPYGDGKSSGDCLSLSTDGKTYISSCTLSLPYICYKQRDNTTILNRCGTFDDDYHYHRATGSCYKHHKLKQTWKTGSAICAAEGGHLVIINNKREADIVTGFLDPPTDGNVAHIGLRDWNKDNTWLSIHGEKIEDLFNRWGGSEPSNSKNTDCGLISSQGTLTSGYCDLSVFSFVCEKDPTTLRYENISGDVYDVATESLN